MRSQLLRFLLVMTLSAGFFFTPGHARILFTNELFENEADTATIDADGNATSQIVLRFGSVINQTLAWVVSTGRFVLSNSLTVNGVLDVDGNTLTLDADNAGVGANVNIVANQGSDADGILRYNATSNQWEIANDGVTFNAISTGGGAANAFVQNGNAFGTTATLGTNDNNILAFEVNNTERMRINTAGDVGIGVTTIPANKKLTVSNTAAPTFNAAGNGMGVSMNGGGGIYMKNSTDNVEGKFESYGGTIQVGVSGTVQAPLLLSYDGGFEGARLDTTGNFGVGTNSPQARLDAQTSGAGVQNVLRLRNAVTAAVNSGSSLLFAANRTTGGITNVAGVAGTITDITNGAYKGMLQFLTADSNVPAERMRIDHLGRVGVNQTTLSDRMTIAESASTTNISTLQAQYSQINNAANIIGEAFHVVASASGNAGDTLRGIFVDAIPGSASVEQAVVIGSGWDKDLVFQDATPNIEMPDNFSFSITNPDGSEALNITQNAAGTPVSMQASAFVQYYTAFAEEFIKDVPNVNADGVRNFGDSAELGTDENGNCLFSVLDDTVGGIARLTSNQANNNCLLYLPTGAGNAQLIFNRANIPTVIMKARASHASATDFVWMGLGDGAVSNNTGPNNGLYFFNNGGANWQGATENGGAITAMNCGVAISPTNFALLKIEVLSATQVRFSVDPNTSDGISFTTCGTSSTNLPTANLGVLMMNHSGTGGGGRTLDVDFFRVWQQ